MPDALRGAGGRGRGPYPPMIHAPTGPPWAFGRRPSFVAAPVQPTLDAEVAAVALRTLIRRYLEGFGPASLADVGQFALVQQARLRPAVPLRGCRTAAGPADEWKVFTLF